MSYLKFYFFLGIALFLSISEVSGQEFYVVTKKTSVNEEANGYGLINYFGKKVLDYNFDNIYWGSHHIIASNYKDGVSEVFDTTGKEIFSKIWNAYFLGNDRFLWIKSFDKAIYSKWQLFNVEGTLISSFNCDNVFFTNFKDYALVRRDSSFLLVDTLGRIVFYSVNYQQVKDSIMHFNAGQLPKPSFDKNENSNAIKIYFDKDKKAYGLKINGVVVVKPIYSRIRKTGSDLLIVKQSGLYGLIDFSGNIVLGMDYENISQVTSRSIIVSKDGKYGIIDRLTKKIRIPFDYESIKIL